LTWSAAQFSQVFIDKQMDIWAQGGQRNWQYQGRLARLSAPAATTWGSRLRRDANATKESNHHVAAGGEIAPNLSSTI
jgi:hypothetical protein